MQTTELYSSLITMKINMYFVCCFVMLFYFDTVISKCVFYRTVAQYLFLKRILIKHAANFLNKILLVEISLAHLHTPGNRFVFIHLTYCFQSLPFHTPLNYSGLTNIHQDGVILQTTLLEVRAFRGTINFHIQKNKKSFELDARDG